MQQYCVIWSCVYIVGESIQYSILYYYVIAQFVIMLFYITELCRLRGCFNWFPLLLLILSSASTRYYNSCIKTLCVVKSLQDKIAEMKTHYLFSAHQQNSDTKCHYLVK